MTELPSDWEIPSFRRLREPIPFLQVPRKHAAIVLGLMLPMGSLVERFGGILWAVVFGIVFGSGAMFALRYLYKADSHWLEHATSHRFADTYWRAR